MPLVAPVAHGVACVPRRLRPQHSDPGSIPAQAIHATLPLSLPHSFPVSLSPSLSGKTKKGKKCLFRHAAGNRTHSSVLTSSWGDRGIRDGAHCLPLPALKTLCLVRDRTCVLPALMNTDPDLLLVDCPLHLARSLSRPLSSTWTDLDVCTNRKQFPNWTPGVPMVIRS